ncbi:50S ribosomal protein L31e [Desulfurococcaceae archaeon MEX13E-LK6-19]|nr:50S ribosomal protein L31e [Desulfurococcaceae archaeon MEX13E-LK6-19]
MSEEKRGETRIYTVPLYRVYWGRRKNRAKRAVRLLREFIKRHIKNAERVVIDNEVNMYIWSRGIEKPPRRVKVEVEYIDEEKTAIVRLAK